MYLLYSRAVFKGASNLRLQTAGSSQKRMAGAADVTFFRHSQLAQSGGFAPFCKAVGNNLNHPSSAPLNQAVVELEPKVHSKYLGMSILFAPICPNGRFFVHFSSQGCFETP